MRLFEIFIGARYLKSKKSQGFISFNTLLSVFIVFIGVFILILVTSVMNGFQSQIKDKILDVDSHITVTGYYSFGNKTGIPKYQTLLNKVKNFEGIVDAVPYFQGQGLFRYNREITPVAIRGLGAKGDMPAQFEKFITEGKKTFSGGKEVLIGSEMAFNNMIKLGDYINLIVPKGSVTASLGAEPGTGRFKVIGFFKTGYYEYDTKLIVMSLKSSQKLYAVGDRIWGIGLKVDDIYKVDWYSKKIQHLVGYDYNTYTAEQRNQNLFYALKLEKLIMTIILFLVIISAGFTIMGTLVMVVMEKRKAIGVLKSMGAKPISIMVIFVLEGFLIGFLGTLFGVVCGIAAALNLEAIIKWLERFINSSGALLYDLFDKGAFYKVSLVPKNIYYIDSIPTEINIGFVVFIAIFAVFLATVSAILPAWSASRLKPVETIRYE